MGIISLEGMLFFSHHGYYDEEQKVGNKYEVDINVKVDLSRPASNDKLQDTVNYEILYQIVNEEMKVPSRLLEHIAQRIIDRTFQSFSVVEEVNVKVSKFNPPVKGVCTRARVELTRGKPHTRIKGF